MRTHSFSPTLSALFQLVRVPFLLLVTAGSAFITYGSVSYFVEGDMHPFILEKLDAGLTMEALFTRALHVHVIAAAFSLPACLALMSRRVMKRIPRVHRWLGRVTGVITLLALVPTGCVLAFWAQGGALSTLGFLLSGVIVAIAMVLGVRTARRGDFVQHRRWVTHVLAQMSVAVTSRALIYAFAHARAFDPETAYLVALWLPVLASIVGAELVAGTLAGRFTSLFIRREHVEARPLALAPVVLDPAR
jgi:hypothetical protein